MYSGIPHLTAIVGTFFLVWFGFDWYYFTHVQNDFLKSIFFLAVPLGAILPIIVPFVCIGVGHFFLRKRLALLGWGLLQAVIIGSFVSSLYKALTGRIQPNLHNLSHDISRGFHFGFYEHGIFWGWPSSHTTIAFAMAFASIHMFPYKKRMHLLVALYALYIGVGISFSIHWFSEFFAGACIGAVIGIVVGDAFRKHLVERGLDEQFPQKDLESEPS